MEISQHQAEAMVYEQLNREYTETEIKAMPYRVAVCGNTIISTAVDGTWHDVYKVEYVPSLILISH